MKKGLFTQSRLFKNDGFTLIELLMVVIILGILAAVVIPQFTSSADDAKVSALKSNLNGIRGALELYLVQHDSVYPDERIVEQLTQYTKQDGTPSTTKDSVNFKYGPYLKQGFPNNPFAVSATKANEVEVDSTIEAIGTVVAVEADPATDTKGWIYVTKTGEFIANTTGYDTY